MNGLSLSELSFRDRSGRNASLSLSPGLNVVFGASNTGKSFALEALDFMLGAESIRRLTELARYERIELALTRGGGGALRLSRSVEGGGFELKDGESSKYSDAKAVVLQPKHNAKNEANISTMLLNASGFSPSRLAANKYGKLENLTFRDLSHFCLVDEGSMMDERSPIHRGDRDDEPKDESVFRFLLTGRDDEALIAVESPSSLRAKRNSRVEFLDEMIAEVEAELSQEHPEASGYASQLARLDREMEEIQARYRAAEESVADFLAERKRLINEIGRVEERRQEVEINLRRFAELDSVLRSDAERLESLEEAGFVLVTGGTRDCPLCGAIAENQVHAKELQSVEETQSAAFAEMRKIELLRSDLALSVSELQRELQEILQTLPEVGARLATVQAEIRAKAPTKENVHIESRAVRDVRRRIGAGLTLVARRQQLVERRADLAATTFSNKPTGLPELKPSGAAVQAFCQVIEETLKLWGYPGQNRVSFDDAAQDIRVNNKPRRDNGKGVRAILHAAFKVAILLFCRAENLPHPGFLVLDTPLLTYRGPRSAAKYGAPAPDELALAKTPLRDRFFDHLSSLRDVGQFIVLENIDLPVDLDRRAVVHEFTGDSSGRYGLL